MSLSFNSFFKRSAASARTNRTTRPDLPPPYSSTIHPNAPSASTSWTSLEKKITLNFRHSDGEEDHSIKSYIHINSATTFLAIQSKIKQRILETGLMSGEEAFNWDIWDTTNEDELMLVIDLQSWPRVRGAILADGASSLLVGISQGWWGYRAPIAQHETERFIRSHQYNESRLLAVGRYVPPPRMSVV